MKAHKNSLEKGKKQSLLEVALRGLDTPNSVLVSV